MTTDASSDLAGRAYWEDLWRRGGHLRFGRFSYFHAAFGRLLRRYARSGMTACEVGCADSVWVPFLVRFGLRVTGLDYSRAGVDRLRATLANDRLEATLVCGDLFDDPLRGTRFDLVFSMGLIEHFENGTAVLNRLKRLVAPGGVLVTIVPNLTGAWGTIQKRLDPEIYKVHVPYGPAQLDELHAAAGLQPVERANYFGVFGPLILNSGPFRRGWPRTHRVVQGTVWILQQAVSWPAAAILGDRAETRLLSSHVVGVYRVDG